MSTSAHALMLDLEENIMGKPIAIIGNAIAAIFWIYLANLLGVEDYGELAFFLAIAEITSTLAMIGSAWTMSVYTAKGVKIEPALYLTTIISSGIATIILYLLFQNIGNIQNKKCVVDLLRILAGF